MLKNTKAHENNIIYVASSNTHSFATDLWSALFFHLRKRHGTMYFIKQYYNACQGLFQLFYMVFFKDNYVSDLHVLAMFCPFIS